MLRNSVTHGRPTGRWHERRRVSELRQGVLDLAGEGNGVGGGKLLLDSMALGQKADSRRANADRGCGRRTTPRRRYISCVLRNARAEIAIALLALEPHVLV